MPKNLPMPSQYDDQTASTRQGWREPPNLNTFAAKKQSKSERRPITDVQNYRNFDRTKYSNMSANLTSYQNTKKMSKLFKKAGAGRFSQNINSRFGESTFSTSQQVTLIRSKFYYRVIQITILHPSVDKLYSP